MSSTRTLVFGLATAASTALLLVVPAAADTPDDAVCTHLVELGAAADPEARVHAPSDLADCQSRVSAMSDCTDPESWSACAEAAETWLDAAACAPVCAGRPADALASQALAQDACRGIATLAAALAGDDPVSEGIPTGSRCARRMIRDVERCERPGDVLRCTAAATTPAALIACRDTCTEDALPASAEVLAETAVRACDHVVPLARAAGDAHAIDETLSRDVCVVSLVMEGDWCPHLEPWLACIEASASYDEVEACKPVCTRGTAAPSISDTSLRQTCEHVMGVVEQELAARGTPPPPMQVDDCVTDLREDLERDCEAPIDALACYARADDLTALMACEALCRPTELKSAVGISPQLAESLAQICTTLTTAPDFGDVEDPKVAYEACLAELAGTAAACVDWTAAERCMKAAVSREELGACMPHCTGEVE